MSTMPSYWDFKIKGTAGSDLVVLHTAPCCISGDKQVPKWRPDPKSLYTLTVKRNTIRLFHAKDSAPNWQLKGRAICNGHSYDEIHKQIIMKQPTSSMGNITKPGYVYGFKKYIYMVRQKAEIWGNAFHDRPLRSKFQYFKQDSHLRFFSWKFIPSHFDFRIGQYCTFLKWWKAYRKGWIYDGSRFQSSRPWKIAIFIRMGSLSRITTNMYQGNPCT